MQLKKENGKLAKQLAEQQGRMNVNLKLEEEQVKKMMVRMKEAAAAEGRQSKV